MTATSDWLERGRPARNEREARKGFRKRAKPARLRRVAGGRPPPSQSLDRRLSQVSSEMLQQHGNGDRGGLGTQSPSAERNYCEP